MKNKSSFILAKEVAEYLRVSKRTVRRLLQSGELKGFRIGNDGPGGNKWLIKEEDVIKYLEGLNV